MMRSLMGGALGAALLLLPMSAGAQSTTDSSQAMSMPTTASAYVMGAGQSDQFEIQSGQLAQQMGSSSSVKHFGAKMISDHTKSTKMVKMAAMKSGMPDMPPPPLRPDQQQMLSQLQSMSGKDFDRTYVMQQLQAHKDALMLQQSYASNGDDANLKKAAAKIVPVVQMHLSMLQSMNDKMGS